MTTYARRGSSGRESARPPTAAPPKERIHPIDLAFLAAARERNVFAGQKAAAPISFAPFDARTRRTEAVIEQDGERQRVMKGAVRTVAAACGMAPSAIDAPALRQAEVGIAVSSATDVAKGAASMVLTEPGLTNIVTLVAQGRAIYQRVLTWIVNKISRTILKAGFVAIAFVATGRFVVSAFAMLLLVFMTDFAKISLATDRVRPSRRPESWAIGGFIAVAVVLGVAMVAETLLFLRLGWTRFGLATDANALSTFSFLLLLYFAAFSIVSVRERRWFWSSAPSRVLVAAVAAELVVGTALTRVGLPSLAPLPWGQMLAVLGYALFACLVVNDALKVALLRRHAPSASG